MLRAVVFDLYETLVSEHDPQWTPPPSIGERLGISEQAFAAGWARTRHDRLRGVLLDHASVLRSICAEEGVTPDPPVVDALVRERLADKATPFVAIDADVLAMVEGLRDGGLRLGLLTNATADETAGWATCPLAPLFDTVAVSALEGVIKPERAAYDLVCDRLDVAPAATAFVGDSEYESAGAAAVGLRPYRATWFIDRWPAGTAAAASAAAETRYPRVRNPRELLEALADA